MGRRIGFGTVIAVLVWLLPHPAAAQASSPYRLTVSHSEGVELSRGDVEAILEHMSYILQTDDDGPTGGASSNDVACNVEFVLDGKVATFSSDDEGPDLDVVVEPAGITALFERDEDVKVVTGIDVCPGAGQVESATGWAVCTDGFTFVVAVQDTVELSGITWAHELGHIEGLRHRSSSPGWIMSRRLYEANTQVDARECEHYRH